MRDPRASNTPLRTRSDSMIVASGASLIGAPRAVPLAPESLARPMARRTASGAVGGASGEVECPSELPPGAAEPPPLAGEPTIDPTVVSRSRTPSTVFATPSTTASRTCVAVEPAVDTASFTTPVASVCSASSSTADEAVSTACDAEPLASTDPTESTALPRHEGAVG